MNGDGRPDLFTAGYADPNTPVPGSYAGFPTNLAGVRDLLFLNQGGRRFREAGVQAGLEASSFRHGLGALFTDVNGDGRPDLYVANDEDPNDLYVNVAWPGGAAADPAGLGFRFEERGEAEGVADPFAGMGVAAANGSLFVTNSRGEPSAAYRLRAGRFVNARPEVDGALGAGFAGLGRHVGRPRELRQPAARARRRGDPGEEPRAATPRPCACSRAPGPARTGRPSAPFPPRASSATGAASPQPTSATTAG